MANHYDRIFKENLEALIVPMTEKLLGLRFPKLEEIPDDLQHTLERKPDFLKKVQHGHSIKDYILHIEIQSQNDSSMAKRMLLYNALLYQIYELPVRQFVFYMGTAAPTMSTHIAYERITFSYEIVNLTDFDYTTFINSTEPETIILAILGNFKQTSPAIVIEQILQHLQELDLEELSFRKYITQLEILSKIRNLQELTVQKIETMPFTYDIKTDIRYQQGQKQGREEGREEIAKTGLRQGLSIENLMVLTKLSKERLLQLKEAIDDEGADSDK